MEVAELNTAGLNAAPTLSRDELKIYFASDRPSPLKPGGGDVDVWVATRTNPSGLFGTPQVINEVSSTAADYPSWVSADDCRLYLHGFRRVPDGGDPNSDQAVWMATRPK